MLYWVAAVLEPNKKQRDEEGKMEELIMQPKIVVAKDDKSAPTKPCVTSANSFSSTSFAKGMFLV